MYRQLCITLNFVKQKQTFAMNYQPRTIQPVIEEASKFFKVIMVSGMRQVGKSTLLKKLSSDNRAVISFDDVRNLEAAKDAPLQFLQLNPPPCFFDEVQRVPEIFGALKIVVDSRSDKGLYWLSGSQKLSLMSQVSDTLPGRLINFELWPFSIYEIAGMGLDQKPYLPGFSLCSNLPILDPENTWDAVFQGFWPELKGAGKTERDRFYKSLVDLYIYRDVRSLSGIEKFDGFERFLITAARRVGQELRLQELAREVGVAQPTIKRWLSIAEASGIIHFLRPYSHNIGKQLVKSPKLYFTDTGLVCLLLNLQNGKELSSSYLAESIFENFVINEIKKSWAHNGKEANFCFYRDNTGMEIDLLIHAQGKYSCVEITSKTTPDTRDTKWLNKAQKLLPDLAETASVICMTEKAYPISPSIVAHSIWQI